MAARINELKARQTPVLDSGNSFEKAVFYGLCGLLFLAPFFRGLFFAQDQRVAVIFATIIFWLVALTQFQRKDKKFSLAIMDCLVLSLPIAYILSGFNAANYSLAIDEVLENLLYFLVFWSAVRLIYSTARIEKLLNIIYLSAIGVSLAGLLTASGIIEIKDGFLTNDGGIIASTFQYKNSLASFLTAAIFIGSFFWSKMQNQVPRLLLITGNFLLLVVFFSTKSHGGYIIFAIFMVALWILTPAAKRFSLIISNLILAVLGFAGSRMFLHNIADKSVAAAWVWLLLGMFILALGQWVTLKYFNKEKGIIIPLKQLLTAIIGTAIPGLIAAGYFGVFQILLEKLHMHGAMERLTMYQDGLRMVLERPVLGWGGGGWSEAYSIYQGYAYTARQTHSYFLQMTIETGLLGLLIAISIWVLFLYKSYTVYKSSLGNNKEQNLAAALICSVLAIISHAVFDFDLSLSALTIVMFALMACLLTIENQNKSKETSLLSNKINIRSGYGLLASSIGAAVILTASLLLISSNNLTNAALEAIKTGNGNNAVALIDKAITMNPLVSENYGIASQLHFALKEPEKAVSYAEQAVEMARYNPDRYSELSRAYLRAGRNEDAVASARKAVELAPLRVTYYERLSDVLISSAINEQKRRQPQSAQKYLNEVLLIPKEISTVLDSVHPDMKKLWVYAPPLIVTDRIKLNLGVANLLMGDLPQASTYMNEAANNPQLQKESLLWQALLAHKQGDANKAQEILQLAQKDNPKIKKQFDDLSFLITSDKN
ncbi:MAG: O-antigen ligase family protein [Bacillota bacterium]